MRVPSSPRGSPGPIPAKCSRRSPTYQAVECGLSPHSGVDSGFQTNCISVTVLPSGSVNQATLSSPGKPLRLPQSGAGLLIGWPASGLGTVIPQQVGSFCLIRSIGYRFPGTPSARLLIAVLRVDLRGVWPVDALALADHLGEAFARSASRLVGMADNDNRVTTDITDLILDEHEDFRRRFVKLWDLRHSGDTGALAAAWQPLLTC